MDGALPQEHRRRDRIRSRADRVLALASGLPGVASGHDRLDRAADADEPRLQPREASRAVGEDRSVVMPDVGHDVQAGAAVRGDGLVEGGVERRHERGDRVRRLARTEAHPGPVALGRDVSHEDVDADVHPRAIREAVLDRRDDARFPRPRRAVEDDDPSRSGHDSRERVCATITASARRGSPGRRSCR